MEISFPIAALLASAFVLCLVLLVVLYRRCRELKDKANRLDRALDAAQMGTFEVNLLVQGSGRLRWSKYHEILFGYQEGEFDGTTEGFRSRLHPDDRERTVAELADAMQSCKPYELESRVVWPDGSIHWIFSRGQFYHDASGRVVGGTGTIIETTDKKKTQKALEQAKVRAEAANRAKSAFLANVSHELRTPLAVILGFSDLLPHQGKEGIERVAQRIRHNGEHLQRIIDDLLDLSSIEAGKWDLRSESVDVAALVAEVREAMLGKAREKGLKLELGTIDNRLARAATDLLRLRQILFNLIGNAIKFTEAGTITIWTKLECGPKGKKMAAIYVADTGIGLTEQEQISLFQPFSRAGGPSTRRNEGTGLGLYLSRKMAEALGGDLELAHSQPGVGSCFKFTFDLALHESRTEVATLGSLTTVSDLPIQTTTENKSLAGLRILIVEDMEDLRSLMCKMLSLAGAIVESAADGLEAVEMGTRGNYDVILMDIQMPHIDGYEAIRRLRRLGFANKIFVLSAHAMPEERLRASQVGSDGHLTKPIRPDELIKHLRLGRRSHETKACAAPSV